MDSVRPLLATAACPGSMEDVATAQIEGAPTLDDLVGTLRACGAVGNVAVDGARLLALDALADSIPLVRCITPRGGGCGDELPACDKMDVRMEPEWAPRMVAACPAFERVHRLVERAKMMMCDRPSDMSAFWHAVITFPGSADQAVHMDNGDAPPGSYATLVFNVRHPVDSGVTAFPTDAQGCLLSDEDDDADRAIESRLHAHGPVFFGGDAPHYGSACRSTSSASRRWYLRRPTTRTTSARARPARARALGSSRLP